jgi:hypothetical protein
LSEPGEVAASAQAVTWWRLSDPSNFKIQISLAAIYRLLSKRLGIADLISLYLSRILAV